MERLMGFVALWCALQIPTLQPTRYERDALTFELKAHMSGFAPCTRRVERRGFRDSNPAAPDWLLPFTLSI